jgi:hypothetical protein
MLPVREYDVHGRVCESKAGAKAKTGAGSDSVSDVHVSIPTLRADPLTAPYLFYDQEDRFARGAGCRYYCLRGPAFLWAALRGFFVGFFCYAGVFLAALAAWFTCRRPLVEQPAEALSDAAFLRLLTEQHPFSSFVERDEDEKGTGGWRVSTRPLERAHSIVAWQRRVPTVSCVVHLTEDRRQFRSIEVRRHRAGAGAGAGAGSGTWALERVDPMMRGEWEAAKVHCLQGLYFLIQFARHPMLHFPQEVLFAALDTVWPDPGHRLRQLVAPHLEFTREVNTAVLKGQNSVLYGPDSCCCFDALPMERGEAQQLFYVAGEPTANPAARLPPPASSASSSDIDPLPLDVVPYAYGLPPTLHEGRGVYLAFQAFVREILANQTRPEDDRRFLALMRSRLDTRGWPADLTVSDLLADILFKSSFQHSYEHAAVADVPLRAHPFPIGRSPFFSDQDLDTDLSLVAPDAEVTVVGCGFCKYACYSSCFEAWTRSCWYDTRLLTTTYAFEPAGAELKLRADAFRAELRDAIPEALRDRIATGIES